MEHINSSEIKTSKWWYKFVVVFLVIIELATGTFAAVKIYQIRQSQVLSASTSTISKSTNHPNPTSALKYYYEPYPGTEIDSTWWVKNSVIWTINNDTLNDRFNYFIEKPQDTYRIIALGDSFTFGDHVNTADSWPEKLEDLLNSKGPCSSYNRYEVLNLGLRGFDIQEEVERYRLRGSKYQPDLIIWMFIPNDFDEIRELLTPIVDNVKQRLAKENIEDPPNLVSIADQKGFKIGKDEFLKQYDENRRFALLNEYVANFNDLFNGSLFMVTFPFLKDTYKGWIINWTNSRKSTFFDSNLPDVYQNNLRVQDGHPNTTGHQRIAEYLFKMLSEKVFATCASF